uniref:Uncharacterized protein n=1 Tax=Arundo donax TaxID=35708 RepID=A0A0A9AKI0_ARUDO
MCPALTIGELTFYSNVSLMRCRHISVKYESHLLVAYFIILSYLPRKSGI